MKWHPDEVVQWTIVLCLCALSRAAFGFKKLRESALLIIQRLMMLNDTLTTISEALKEET